MSEQAHQNFPGIISAIRKEIDTDPISHIVILSYEFDDTQFINFATGRSPLENSENIKADIFKLKNIRPVIFYDASKTKAIENLLPFCEPHPYDSNAFGCHHPKAYCIITTNKVHLAIGSFNFTKSGIFHNREVMDYWCWGKTDTEDIHILAQWTDFLEKKYAERLPEGNRGKLEEICRELRNRVAPFPQTVGEQQSRLLWSGYNDGNGLERLRQIWSDWYPGREPKSLFVVSPFFDQNPDTGNIMDDLHERFPAISNIGIASGYGSVSKEHYGSKENISSTFFAVPEELQQAESDSLASPLNLKNGEIRLERSLHAKALLLADGNEGILYIGSANFSRNAWRGRNQELGAVYRIPQCKKTIDDIKKALWVNGDDRFSEIPDTLPQSVEDPEESVFTLSIYPKFIEYITLHFESSDTQNIKARFEFILKTNVHPTWNDYKSIRWKNDCVYSETIPLLVEDGLWVSQWIDPGIWRKNLALGHSLCFEHTTGEEVYLPFGCSARDSDQADMAVCRAAKLSAYECLRFLCGYQLSNDDGDYDDGEESEGASGSNEKHDTDLPVATAEFSDYDRNSNVVVAMQQYLNVFRYLEESYSGKNGRTPNYDEFNTLIQSIAVDESDKDEAKLFKLGELALFLNKLPDAEHKEKCFDKLMDRFANYRNLCPEYARFVLSQVEREERDK